MYLHGVAANQVPVKAKIAGDRPNLFEEESASVVCVVSSMEENTYLVVIDDNALFMSIIDYVLYYVGTI